MNRARIFLSLLALVLLLSETSGWQEPSSRLKDTVQGHVNQHQGPIVREVVRLLSIPDVASDRPNIRRKAELLNRLFAKRGFEARLLETEGNPLVYAERKTAGANRTLLFYCHYDGQPVDPARWRQESPWKPILRRGKLEDGAELVEDFPSRNEFDPDWRLYARSASDDTSPIVALLAAVDALEAVRIPLSASLRVILDGEEEAGSPSLVPAIARYRQLLEADAMLILDGPIHPSNRPTLVFGARGILTLQLTLYGPRFPLHSGHFGNWIPNPAMRLAQLLATMKDENGKTVIEGFYEGISFSDHEREVMRSVPDDEKSLLEFFGVAGPDRVGESLQEAVNFPSLNVRGLESGWVGEESRTIIPHQAVAEIDVRLVPETPPDLMLSRIFAHIRKQGYTIVDSEPENEVRLASDKLVKVVIGDRTEAYRTPLDAPQTEQLIRALREVWKTEPVLIRTSGGTVPISPFIQALGFPAFSLPLVNFDNNQHSPNENLRLGHLFQGIVSIAAILAG